jgi:hypothetical protein
MIGARGVVAVALVIAAIAGCGKKKAATSDRPAGTAADPVTVCERLADVCKLDGSRLGVCSAQKSGPGYVCASQH